MVIFHELVYAGSLAGGASGGGLVYSPAQYSSLFGQVDMLHIGGYASQVTGSSPFFSLAFQISPDGHNWVSNTIAVLGMTLSTSQENFFQGISDNSKLDFLPPFRRLLINVGGSTSNVLIGCLRLWVTGRDTSRKAKGLVLPSS